jgi:hypothetical protein
LQIKLYIQETLFEYYEKVKGGKGDISSLLELSLAIYAHCPICGGKNCPEFLGYYTREAVDEKGRFFKDLPIARFKCNRKGNNIKVDHKTFSLLPYQLIPYRKYCIEFTIEGCKARNKEGSCVNDALDDLAERAEDDLSINGSQIQRMDTIAEEAIEKILTSGYYPEFEDTIYQHSSGEERIKKFTEFAEGFECLNQICDTQGTAALGYDFYIRGGGYYKNAHFLFGTPSQFRDRGG